MPTRVTPPFHAEQQLIEGLHVSPPEQGRSQCHHLREPARIGSTGACFGERRNPARRVCLRGSARQNARMVHAECSAGLVLSGGGVRGAYEAGVLAGIVDVLDLRPEDASPFRVFVGTSVGAINAAYLAAHADRGDLGVAELTQLWQALDLSEHFRIHPRGLLGARKRFWFSDAAIEKEGPLELGRSLLDPRPLDKLVRQAIPWQRLHDNVARSHVRALVVTALEIAHGRTTMFSQLAPGAVFHPSRDPRRQISQEVITADHVLASAAIPIVFPSRRIGRRYYCDGGLRFNTPIAPAIRSGADRLVVVSLQRRFPTRESYTQDPDHTVAYPSLFFLLGKLINALLLDPVSYDLEVLERFNRVVDVLESTLPPEEMERVSQVLVESRGMGYRRLDTLLFTPSEDIGQLAGRYIEARLDRDRLGWMQRWFLDQTAKSTVAREADLASYFLFDGGFAAELIDLGRRDVHARAEDVRRFFQRRVVASTTSPKRSGTAA